MTADAAAPARSVTPALFVLAAFTGAALIFFVQPMMAKLVLPLLGGSPAVWNTSMAFFQAALLAGYGYAHLLQRLPTVKAQALVHLAVLALAALALPLRISGLMGEPASGAPALWLLGVLTLSIGAPFAAVSATAPLVQAWHARVFGGARGEPYVLYAASNLGSLIALLAYPIVVEPTVTLVGQRYGWSGAYLLFALVMAALAFTAARAAPGRAAPRPAEEAAPITWRTRLTWLALAAIPSSLMLGVTAHLSMDVASAPFVWVAPLALYLVTFIIAFQARPLIPPEWALAVQAFALPVSLYALPLEERSILIQFAVHLIGFFFSALVCHQALVARRPAAGRLTEFYLWLSLGGVVGGAFNAFVAPVIFDRVVEYPLALALAALARPWRIGRLTTWEGGVAVTGLLAAAASITLMHFPPKHVLTLDTYGVVTGLLAVPVASAVLLRERGLMFALMVAALALAADAAGQRSEAIATDRSFFGVLRQSTVNLPYLGGEVRKLVHGTTLHGAQAKDPRFRCRPLLYYAPQTPIGQVFKGKLDRNVPLNIATVGLGTGAVAAYTRPGDALTFFEIDPTVVRLSSDPKVFSYTTECARGKIAYRIGDARLTLAREPAGAFDILLVDAFSSDAIPAHLLTVEAMRMYLAKLKPDGVLILHLSNRYLALAAPAEAAAKAAGGASLHQCHECDRAGLYMWESPEEVVIVARSAAALADFKAQPQWEIPPPARGRPWTDDYMNLFGALVARLRGEG